MAFKNITTLDTEFSCIKENFTTAIRKAYINIIEPLISKSNFIRVTVQYRYGLFNW